MRDWKFPDAANVIDWDENISSRDPAKREAPFRHIQRQIEAAQLFGLDAMLVVPGVLESYTPTTRCISTV
jgi:hypothetical protein